MAIMPVTKERGHTWAARPPVRSSDAILEETEAQVVRYVRADRDVRAWNGGRRDEFIGLVRHKLCWA